MVPRCLAALLAGLALAWAIAACGEGGSGTVATQLAARTATGERTTEAPTQTVTAPERTTEARTETVTAPERTTEARTETVTAPAKTATTPAKTATTPAETATT